MGLILSEQACVRSSFSPNEKALFFKHSIFNLSTFLVYKGHVLKKRKLDNKQEPALPHVVNGY